MSAGESIRAACIGQNFKWQVSRRRCGGQGKRGKKGLAEEEACSLFALNLVPVCAPGGGKKGDARVLEEPGATDNLITHALARIMKLPNKLLSLMCVEGQANEQGDKNVRSLNLTNRHGIKHSM